MSKRHTPGPWGRWEQGGLLICKDIGNGNLQEVAWVQGCSTLGEEEANADLIAAAPDLLEALQDLADDISDRFDMDSPSTNPGIKYCVSAARQAIAKALGE